MIEQTQAQQTQAQAPKRPASSVPLLVGGAFFAGIAAFLGWGVWEATHPAPVPLQGMVDARTISVSAKVPGRLAELKVREGDVLKAGDTVLLSGVVYTARDQAHKRMMEALDKGETLPFDLEGSAIYYVGPTPERPGVGIGAAGPTTSGRMDAMSPRLLDLGNKIMIGKGKRDAAVKAAVVRNGAVYLAALGGAGALMAKSVQTLEVIAWPDLGCEAVRRLTVRALPLPVILDAHGGDLYEEGPAAYLAAL